MEDSSANERITLRVSRHSAKGGGMMSCIHQRVSPNGQGIYCRLVNIGVPASVDPCGPCLRETGGESPTFPLQTSALRELVGRTEEKPIAVCTTRKPNAKRSPPTLVKRIKSAARAYWAFYRSGKPMLSRQETDDRLAICQSCEHKSVHKVLDLCNLCGCLLKFKSKLPTERCPLRKWPGDESGGCGGC